MKRLVAILTNFFAIGALLFSNACSAGVSLPVEQVVETGPTISPTNTSQPAATVPAAAPKAPPASGQQPGDPGFLATEILGRPTGTSITVNVVPALEMELYYEYGSAPGSYTAQTPAQVAAAGAPIETLLDGLQPDMRYYYRIRYRSSGAQEFAAGPERTFVTQRAPGSTFTFAIQGDSHPERLKKQFDPTLYSRTLMSAAAIQPDFYLTMGDDFSVDTLKAVNPETVTALYLNQRQYLGLIGAPVFLVNGNHEQAALANLNGTLDNVAVWAQTARNAYYPQPAPDAFYTGDAQPVEPIGLLRDYYAFTWGDALFVVIDPYWHSTHPVDNQFGVDRDEKKKRDLWNVTLGDTQYQWLKSTLESSPARYKFVFAHHVNGTGRGGIEQAGAYEWGDAAGLAAHRPGWDKTVHQLMVDNHVTIFFQGHDHIFVRQELDGVIYQTLPEPANPFYTYENEAAFKSGDKFPNSGHVRVTVAPTGVTVEYIRSYLDRLDELAFTYTAGRAAQATPAPVVTAIAPVPTALPSSAGGPNDTTVNIILGRPTADSITASLLAPSDQRIVLAYGTEPGKYIHQTSPIELQANSPQPIQVTGLAPDTTYYYNLLANGTPTTEHSVHTQRAPGSPFTFTIDADPHNRDPRFDGALYATMLANVCRDRPDFHINLGDTFMTEKVRPQTYAEAESTFHDLRPYLGIPGTNAALFLINGNHEGELGWLLHGKDANLPIWSTQLRQLYYPNPTPGGFYTGSSANDPALGSVRDGYFAWTWGDALFVVLDPFWYTTTKPRNDDRNSNWNWTLGREQYDWLQSTLATSDKPFKFIFIHHLVGGDQDGRGGVEVAKFFEWGGDNPDGSYGFAEQRPGWGKPIHQLLVENHVSAVFHGHDHVFVKQTLDGIVYQELPQPSNAESNKTSLASDYGYLQGDVFGSSGHLRVTVTPTQVTVSYVRAYLPPDERNGRVDYAYTIVLQESRGIGPAQLSQTGRVSRDS